MLSLKENTNYFQKQPCFKNLRESDLVGIVKSAVLKTRMIGDVVYNVGDIANKLYFIKEGDVKVIINSASYFSKAKTTAVLM